MDTHTFKTMVNGKECDIQIKKGLTWGETQELLKHATSVTPEGVEKVNFSNISDILIQKTIVGGLPFPITDYTALKNMDMAEMSAILGEIFSVLPLEKYFENLKMDSNPLLNLTQ